MEVQKLVLFKIILDLTWITSEMKSFYRAVSDDKDS